MKKYFFPRVSPKTRSILETGGLAAAFTSGGVDGLGGSRAVWTRAVWTRAVLVRAIWTRAI